MIARLLAILSISTSLLAVPYAPPVPALFVRGDVDQSGKPELSDAIVTLGYLFLSQPAPGCLAASDVNDDDVVNLSDPIYLLHALFLGGPAPPEPASACGSDPTPGGLDCGAHAPCEFESLVDAYSTLRTIAGNGLVEDGSNGWQPQYEGGPSVAADLSNPHMAMADDAGNIFIADKEAHAIRKVTPDRLIVTVAGTNEAGDDGDSPGPGAQRRLSSPNGLFVRGDSTVYILDLDNGKVRRLSPDGELTTLFTVPEGIALGRGLWVREDEGLVYFSSGSVIKKWTPAGGVEVHAAGFSGLGNLTVDPAGNLVATDRNAHRVFQVGADGSLTAIAGNGLTSGGGDGELALETGLNEVRGIWFLENGAYFLATHRGSQIWYVDTGGIIHLFLDGARGHVHSGDGEHFRTPGEKISEARAVTVDIRGNVIITENDFGYVRMVERN